MATVTLPTRQIQSEQPKTKAHKMANRFRAWLRRKLNLSGKTQHRETVSDGSNSQTAAPSTRKESPPPPYATIDLLPWSIDGSEDIEVLRARNPATRPPSEQARVSCPPRPITSMRSDTAVKAASAAAVIGTIDALDEPNPSMVAARTAQAIAVAVSTSRSYAAFIAAVIAAESSALLSIENHRDNSLPDRCFERQKNAIHAAADTALAAKAGMPVGSWPFNIYNTHIPAPSSQKDSPSTSAD